MSSTRSLSDQNWSFRQIERIDALGAEFERAWNERLSPAIEAVLADHADLPRSMLLFELVRLECALKRREGGRPEIDEYLRRFPQDRDAIERVWRQGAMTSHSGSSPTEALESWPSPPDLQPRQLGRFRILDKLGEGGFGVVYLAHDPQIGGNVALKVLHRRLLESPERKAQIRNEFLVGKKLDHPHLVKTLEIEEQGEQLIIVQQLIEGSNLSDWRHKNRPTPHQVAELMIPVAQALAYLHEQGYTHRDLKPANILVDKHQRAYVADFGLALHEDEQRRHKGEIAGTRAYMSPEQVRRQAHLVDGQSDIWSVGVILYRLLTDRLPFGGPPPHRDSENYNEYRRDLEEEISDHDPRPPCMICPGLSRKLQEICLRCLEKRKRHRYQTAHDLADDLRLYLEKSGDGSPAAVPRRPIRIVPKGLRSFDAADAEFFLELLPGPRTSAGLPASLSFWRTRLSGTNGTDPLDAGVIYGPSGCGKSSLVKAGLLPILGDDCLPLVVEATAADTEARLLKALRYAVPDLPASDSLVDACRRIADHGGECGRRILLVFDQFEQWLHSHPDVRQSQLLAGVRYCNGTRLQALFLVRDDFWMPLARFMERFEISLQENVNMAAVDLFDRDHARNILVAFGRAYGRLPGEGELTDEQERFVESAIESLAEEGRVICVRLALFAEMMKDRPWTQKELAAVGGAKGVGASFLEQKFGRNAPAVYRPHCAAVRKVLDCLLPPFGSDLKGQMRTAGELRAAAGYSTTRAFDQLIQILNSDLKLLAPTASDDPDSPPEAAGREPCGYQLTHDYLVPSIREWLTTELGRTRAGRAQLRLRERADDWNRRPDPRRLPSLWETAQIIAGTKPASWTTSQARMMLQARRWHARRLSMYGLTLAFALIGGTAWRHRQLQTQRRRDADAAVARLMEKEIRHVAPVLREMDATRDLWVDQLQRMADRADASPAEKLRAELALVSHDRQRLPGLLELVLQADAETLRVVRDWLASAARPAPGELWRLARSPRQSGAAQLRIAALLAEFDPEPEESWRAIAPPVAKALVTDASLDANAWAELLTPVRERLAPPLSDLYLKGAATSAQRLAAAQLLSKLGSTELLCRLASDADATSLSLLMRPLLRDPERAIRELQQAPRATAPASWPGDRPQEPPPAELAARFAEADGALCATHGWFSRLPLEQVDLLLSQSQAAGYRPVSLRLVDAARGESGSVETAWVSGAFWRDGVQTVVAPKLGLEEFRQRDEDLRREGFVPCDLSVIQRADQTELFALWCARPPWVIDAAAYLDVPESQHEQSWRPLNEMGFLPLVNIKRRMPETHEGFYSSIRWKCRGASVFVDAWEAPWRQVARTSLPGWTQMDLRASQAIDDTPLFAGTWWNNSEFASFMAPLASPAEHAARASQLEQLGCRPMKVAALIGDSGSHQVASLWHRPIVLEDQQRLAAQRTSRRAVLLLQLGEAAELTAALQQVGDPTLRSLVIHGLSDCGVPAAQSIALLESSKNERVQDGILLSLALPPGESIDADSKRRLETWLGRTRQAERPFLTSVADLLAGRWYAKEPRARDVQLADREPPRSSRQFENGQRQRFIRVERTDEVWLGAPASDRERDPAVELQHRVEIPRDFYLLDREVTVEQFLRFSPDFDYAPNYSPNPNCPINMVGWVDCVKYCRWLSEQEGIPPHEMCYPTIAEIDAGASIPADFLSRTGYRLPTEAEWEHACRAGTLTPRPFGAVASLLPRYAWTAENSQFHACPVAQTLPNGLGLFDMLGNVMEWCHDPYADYPRDPQNVFSDSGRGGLSLKSDETRVVRGGAFLHAPSAARSSQRYAVSPARRLPFMGFRIARTCPKE